MQIKKQATAAPGRQYQQPLLVGYTEAVMLALRSS